MGHQEIKSKIDTEQKVFNSSRPTPIYGTIPIYDFTTAPSTIKGVHAWNMLTFTSFYGIYHYTLVMPHSMLMMGCGGLSLIFLMGTMNYTMTSFTTVADARLSADGELLNVTTVKGWNSNIPLKDISLEKIHQARWYCLAKVNGRRVQLYFDYIDTNPKQLIDKELCLAVMDPDVHKIKFLE